jgi:hypothetical protein
MENIGCAVEGAAVSIDKAIDNHTDSCSPSTCPNFYTCEQHKEKRDYAAGKMGPTYFIKDGE